MGAIIMTTTTAMMIFMMMNYVPELEAGVNDDVDDDEHNLILNSLCSIIASSCWEINHDDEDNYCDDGVDDVDDDD